MTPDERERMQILCERIATEKDHREFAELIRQLNVLLDAKDRRLVSKEK
jgi:hypothetical protein